MECSGQNPGDLVGLLVFRQEKSLLLHKVKRSTLFCRTWTFSSSPCVTSEGHQAPPWAPQRVMKLASSRELTIFKAEGAGSTGWAGPGAR